MSRSHISSSVPADIAERISDVDDDISAEQERMIDERIDALIAEHLNNPDDMNELLGDMNIGAHIARALRYLDGAIKESQTGESTYRSDALFTALNNLQRDVNAKARAWWLDEARERAESEVLG